MFGALTKVILREAMKGVLPLEVYKRTDKIGFATPIEKRIFHISSKSHKIIQEYIKNSEFMKMDFLEIKNIPKVFHERANFATFSLAKFVDIWS